MKNYQHTQFGSAIVLSLGAIGLATLLFAASSSRPALNLSGGAFLILVGTLFSTLTIAIEDGMLRASFGPGLIKKKVRLADIASVRPIPVRWWYGWGVHVTPYG